MTNIVLRPDLKTAGGEISDILINGRYAGSMSLVYREGDRIGGSVQLDRTSISAKEKHDVVRYVQNYIQDLIVAVRAADCDVVVTNSPYDHIIATDRDELGQAKEMDDADDAAYGFDEPETDWEADDEMLLYDINDDDDVLGDAPGDIDAMEMRQPAVYELVIVGEQRNQVEYHVYDQNKIWVAEALFKLRGLTCTGDINFMVNPNDEEIEAVADLVVSDFDENEVDEFQISVKHRGKEIETIELTHEDLLDLQEYNGGSELLSDDFTVSLARDDGDMLTYEIYNQAKGGLPIGTATVDIANRQLSGFMDFREMCSEDEREAVATLLMRELDKEKEYKELNLSVLHRNEKIDEMHFESEQVH